MSWFMSHYHHGILHFSSYEQLSVPCIDTVSDAFRPLPMCFCALNSFPATSSCWSLFFMQSEARNHFSLTAFPDSYGWIMCLSFRLFDLLGTYTPDNIYHTVLQRPLYLSMSFIRLEVRWRQGMPCLPVYSLYLTQWITHIRKWINICWIN